MTLLSRVLLKQSIRHFEINKDTKGMQVEVKVVITLNKEYQNDVLNEIFTQYLIA